MAVTRLDLLRVVAVCLLGGGGVVSALLVGKLHLRAIQAWLCRHEAELSRDIAYLRLPFTARQVVMAQAGSLALGVLAWVLANALLASVFLLPPLCVTAVLSTRRARRTSELEQQLDGWLTGLASTLRATPALGEAMEYSLGLVASPLRDELETLVKEQKLGTSLDEALQRMGRRVASRTLQTALGTLRVGQRTGGDVSKILERSARTLREMARLEGVVRVKTAEGKAQGYVLGLLPFPLVALFRYLDPGYLDPLVSCSRGHMVIACAGLCWLTSIVLTRRILRVDI